MESMALFASRLPGWEQRKAMRAIPSIAGPASRPSSSANPPAAPTPWRTASTGRSAAFLRTVAQRAPPLATTGPAGLALRPRRGPAASPVPCPGAARASQAAAGIAAVAGGACQVTMHELPSSLRLEVLVRRGEGQGDEPPPSSLPPLVFIHGSYHAAWCWDEHWMPHYARQGFDCYAISLLGQGGSDSPLDATVAGTIQSHAADVSDVIRRVVQRPPILIGHSFGGLIVQAYLSMLALPHSGAGELHKLAGAALVCSVPPSGNKDLVMRFLATRPILSIKVTLSLAAKMFATNTGLCRDSFFSPDMPEAEVKRYQLLLGKSSKMPLFDLRQLNASLPVPRPPPGGTPPVFILGAENDAVLDVPALQETTEFFNAPYTLVPNIAHDVMLDTPWERAAQVLSSWMVTVADSK